MTRGSLDTDETEGWRWGRRGVATSETEEKQRVGRAKSISEAEEGCGGGGDVLALVAVPVEISARSWSVIRLREWERRPRTYVCVMDIPYSRTLRKVPISIGPCL